MAQSMDLQVSLSGNMHNSLGASITEAAGTFKGRFSRTLASGSFFTASVWTEVTYIYWSAPGIPSESHVPQHERRSVRRKGRP
ncbi:uncharacterized protein V6R79_023927 [Siganus canaliculatus]